MKRILAVSLLLLPTWASPSAGQVRVPGTDLIHFGQVDEGVFKGSKPKTDADFRFLHSLHVRYVMDLEFLPVLDAPERRHAKKYGIVFLAARINASPVSPSQEHVEKTLAILR